MTPGPLESFVAAVETTLRESAGVEVVAGSAARAPGIDRFDDVSILLRLDADKPGWLILRIPPATAAELAGRVLGSVEEKPDTALIRDCVAELLNVIAGQAKALVYGTPRHFTLATPTVVTAAPTGDSADQWVIPFNSDVGAFSLLVCLPLAVVGTREPTAEDEKG
jgi:CheY-specific phosphatase CheX